MNGSLHRKIAHATVDVVAAQNELDATMSSYRASVVAGLPGARQDALLNTAHDRLTILLDAIGRQQTYLRQALLQQGD